MNWNDKTNLIKLSDIKKLLRLKGTWGDIIGKLTLRILGIAQINKIYSDLEPYKGKEFISKALENHGIKYKIHPDELDNIPKEGGFIVVANHPTGVIDGLIMFDIMLSHRDDFKTIGNFLLNNIKKLEPLIFSVNPFSDNKKIKSSLGGLKLAIEHISNGGVIGIFPSGEVSTYYGNKYISDKDWSTSMTKLIVNSKVPVVPIFFQQTNSRLFHLLGKIHPILRTARLPREFLNKRGQTIHLSIGKPIKPKMMAKFENISQVSSFLRNATYALEGNLLSEKTSTNNHTNIEGAKIEASKDRKVLREEALKLSEKNLVFSAAKYQCFLSDAQDCPNILHEIGIQREITFRAVGEGTNKSIDLDEYDNYYKHLILWDNAEDRLVGAYRLGIGKEIISKYGINGFYVNDLFNITPELSFFEDTIELGRSFICQEYQKEGIPLMLLLKGLLQSVVKYKDCKYLMGPVSISSWYPDFYRSLMVSFIRKNFSAQEDIKKLFSPKTPFKEDYLKVTPDKFINQIDSIELFDKILSNCSRNKYKLPVLVMKYISMGARIAEFNVDNTFNDCLDGLIVLKLTDVPKTYISLFSRDSDNKDEILNRFGYTGS